MQDEKGLSKTETYFSFNYWSPSCTSEGLASICDFVTNAIYHGLHHLYEEGNIKPAIISSITMLWDRFESTFISPTGRHYRSLYIPVMTSLGRGGRKAPWRRFGLQLLGLNDFWASQAYTAGSSLWRTTCLLLSFSFLGGCLFSSFHLLCLKKFQYK